jgi:hypothetical protein
LVTRAHRYHGWTLTVGGRQMILGESDNGWGALEAGKIKTNAENPRSITESLTSSAENPRSITEGPAASAENPRSIPERLIPSAENPRSLMESPAASAENPRSTAEKPRSSAENPRSRPIAAASLSLSFKAESNKAAAAIARVEVSTGKVKVRRSLVSRGFQLSKKRERTARGRSGSDPVVRANLEALASIGLRRNRFVLELCHLGHVTPDYILGQKRRLEAEGRYSHGLLLTVVRSKDYLPERYVPRENPDPQPQLFGAKMEPEDEVEHIPGIEPDPSIHERMSESGMTAARAWSAVMGQLKADMPKAGYDKWVRDTVLLSARDGTFTVGAPDGYARDWLESRLASTVRRQLTGICNRPVEVKFIDINGLSAAICKD